MKCLAKKLWSQIICDHRQNEGCEHQIVLKMMMMMIIIFVLIPNSSIK